MAVSIAFEGPEGVGKTAQVKVLAEVLEGWLNLPVLTVREPGGTDPGELIRGILEREDLQNMHSRTFVLLYSAARNELIFNKALRWSEENPKGFILADRCWWSTFAHQGVDGADYWYIRDMQKPFIRVWPDKVIYTDLHPDETTLRMERSRKMKESRWWRDYVGIERLARVRQNYLDLVNEFWKKTLLLDGFDNPAQRAFQSLVFILGKEPFDLTSEVESDILRIWEKATGLSYEAMLKVESEVRIKMGLRDKEELRGLMLGDWEIMGLTDLISGIEGGNFRGERKR